MDAREQRVWFVTGCSTGFGRHIAEHLLGQGQRVVVTARKTDKIADLARPGQALVLALDVTDAAQCKEAAAQALAHFGQLDVLVNNAGIGYFAAVEETNAEQARELMEVNFFGAANMIHAVLPSMRARRSGCIVNLTSIGGISGFEAVGYYSASKFALEGLSDTLAKELAPLGVKVLTVEPSGFRTEWAGSANETSTPIADYDSTAGAARRAYHASVGKQAGDPRRAAAAIFQAVTAERPPRYLLLGNEAMEVGMAKLEEMRTDFSGWEQVSRGADFPPNEA
ncbi:oxidoreductase [Massilia niabensis]|uniref:Oxidoreductase n=1 Tax=Massilia niabensis TaxID=544910 RepID=A0ABW0L5J2_9BURK